MNYPFQDCKRRYLPQKPCFVRYRSECDISLFSLGFTSLGSYDFKLDTLSIRKGGVVFKRESGRSGRGGGNKLKVENKHKNNDLAATKKRKLWRRYSKKQLIVSGFL